MQISSFVAASVVAAVVAGQAAMSSYNPSAYFSSLEALGSSVLASEGTSSVIGALSSFVSDFSITGTGMAATATAPSGSSASHPGSAGGTSTAAHAAATGGSSSSSHGAAAPTSVSAGGALAAAGMAAIAIVL